MPARDRDRDGDVSACPECDHCQPNQRQTYPDDEGEWACYQCGATFDEPNWRESNSAGRNWRSSPYSRLLDDADPEVIG